MRPAVRRVTMFVVGWVVGVSVLGSLTFVVVDLAGQVVAGPDGAASGPLAAGTADGSPSPRGSTARPSGTGRSSGGSSSTADPGDGGGATDGDGDGTDSGGTGSGDGPTTPGTTPGGGSADPTTPSTPSTPGGPTADPTSPGSTSPPTTTPKPKPTKPENAPKTTSFTTDGGTAVLTCTGKSIRVDSIRVRDGWRFGQRVVPSQGRATVTFEQTADGTSIAIDIACVGGKPAKTGEKTTPGGGKGKGKGTGTTGGNGGAKATGPGGSGTAEAPGAP